MLPDKSKIASLILGQGNPPPGPGAEDGGASDGGLSSAADDLIAAMKTGDATGVADALRAAFSMLEAEPHDEGGTDGPAPE